MDVRVGDAAPSAGEDVVTNEEYRKAYEDGATGRDIRLCGEGGMEWDYWQARMAGNAERDTLEKEAEHGYLYGEAS